MRELQMRLALGLLLCVVSCSVAHAQVRSADLKLSVDTSLLNFQKGEFETRAEDLGAPKERSWGFGPLASAPGGGLPAYAAFSVGYAFHRHIVPAVQLSWGLQRHESNQAFYGKNTEKTATFMVRPLLEVPFSPARRLVVSGLLGFDVRWLREKIKSHGGPAGAETTERGLRAFGPGFGLSMHAFLNDWCSLDLSVIYTELFMREHWAEDGITQHGGLGYRGRTLGLTFGIGAWLRRRPAG